MNDKRLAGQRIIITRSQAQARTFSEKIEQHGGIPIEIPLLTFQKPRELTSIKKRIAEVQHYDWIVFTSVNGVEFFFSFLRECQISVDQIRSLKFAVVGSKTKTLLESYGLSVDVMPTDFVAESLLACLKQTVGKHERILFPKGNLARPIIPAGLRALGFNVTEVSVYETVAEERSKRQLANLLSAKKADIITFTSSSTVSYFYQWLQGENGEEWLADLTVACIGPITAETAFNFGLSVDVIAESYTIDGLIKAIIHYVEEGFYEKS